MTTDFKYMNSTVWNRFSIAFNDNKTALNNSNNIEQIYIDMYKRLPWVSYVDLDYNLLIIGN